MPSLDTPWAPEGPERIQEAYAIPPTLALIFEFFYDIELGAQAK